MTTKTLSTRALKALAILKAGGRFRYGLRPTKFGEKFMWNLVGHKGFGHVTAHELIDAGLLEEHGMSSGITGIASYHKLTAVGEAAPFNAPIPAKE